MDACPQAKRKHSMFELHVGCNTQGEVGSRRRPAEIRASQQNQSEKGDVVKYCNRNVNNSITPKTIENLF